MSINNPLEMYPAKNPFSTFISKTSFSNENFVASGKRSLMAALTAYTPPFISQVFIPNTFS